MGWSIPQILSHSSHTHCDVYANVHTETLLELSTSLYHASNQHSICQCGTVGDRTAEIWDCLAGIVPFSTLDPQKAHLVATLGFPRTDSKREPALKLSMWASASVKGKNLCSRVAYCGVTTSRLQLERSPLMTSSFLLHGGGGRSSWHEPQLSRGKTLTMASRDLCKPDAASFSHLEQLNKWIILIVTPGQGHSGQVVECRHSQAVSEAELLPIDRPKGRPGTLTLTF